MSVFEVNYELGTGYENKIDLSVRLAVKPSEVEITKLITAIEILNSFAEKNLHLKSEPIIIKAKEQVNG